MCGGNLQKVFIFVVLVLAQNGSSQLQFSGSNIELYDGSYIDPQQEYDKPSLPIKKFKYVRNVFTPITSDQSSTIAEGSFYNKMKVVTRIQKFGPTRSYPVMTNKSTNNFDKQKQFFNHGKGESGTEEYKDETTLIISPTLEPSQTSKTPSHKIWTIIFPNKDETTIARSNEKELIESSTRAFLPSRTKERSIKVTSTTTDDYEDETLATSNEKKLIESITKTVLPSRTKERFIKLIATDDYDEITLNEKRFIKSTTKAFRPSHTSARSSKITSDTTYDYDDESTLATPTTTKAFTPSRTSEKSRTITYNYDDETTTIALNDSFLKKITTTAFRPSRTGERSNESTISIAYENEVETTLKSSAKDKLQVSRSFRPVLKGESTFKSSNAIIKTYDYDHELTLAPPNEIMLGKSTANAFIPSRTSEKSNKYKITLNNGYRENSSTIENSQPTLTKSIELNTFTTTYEYYDETTLATVNEKMLISSTPKAFRTLQTTEKSNKLTNTTTYYYDDETILKTKNILFTVEHSLSSLKKEESNEPTSTLDYKDQATSNTDSKVSKLKSHSQTHDKLLRQSTLTFNKLLHPTRVNIIKQIETTNLKKKVFDVTRTSLNNNINKQLFVSKDSQQPKLTTKKTYIPTRSKDSTPTPVTGKLFTNLNKILTDLYRDIETSKITYLNRFLDYDFPRTSTGNTFDYDKHLESTMTTSTESNYYVVQDIEETTTSLPFLTKFEDVASGDITLPKDLTHEAIAKTEKPVNLNKHINEAVTPLMPILTINPTRTTKSGETFPTRSFHMTKIRPTQSFTRFARVKPTTKISTLPIFTALNTQLIKGPDIIRAKKITLQPIFTHEKAKPDNKIDNSVQEVLKQFLKEGDSDDEDLINAKDQYLDKVPTTLPPTIPPSPKTLAECKMPTTRPPPTTTPTTTTTTTTKPPPKFDLPALLAIVTNLTIDYDVNLTHNLNESLQVYSIPTCKTPPTKTISITPPITTTTIPPAYEAVAAGYGVIVSKCFVCGLDEPGIPFDANCADAFAGDFLPLVPVDPTARGKLSKFRKYCRFKDVHGMFLNRSDPRSVYGRWTGGCSVRWNDISGVYTQRSCRNRYRATMGKHFASKRMAKLEMALTGVENGCIASPSASLIPLSRSISLFAKFHVCVCSGNWCNLSVRLHENNNLFNMLLMLLTAVR